MRETLQDRISNATTLLDVLLILKEKTMLDTHVSTLAYVREIIQEYNEENGYGIISASPFPLLSEQESYTIQAYYFNSDLIFEKDDKVLIVFTDLNFISNLNNVSTEPKITKDTLTHNLKYGIIVPMIATQTSAKLDKKYVRYDKDQNLTSQQQKKARDNIDTIKRSDAVNKSGDTMSGTLKLASIDDALEMPNNAMIKTSIDGGLRTIWGYDANNDRMLMGSQYAIAALRGQTTRPKYTTDGSTYNDIALLSDVTGGLTPTFVGQFQTINLNIEGGSYVGAKFTIGSTNAARNGLYIFTYGNCMILLPIYNAVIGTVYKVSAALLDSGGSYSTKVLSYTVDNLSTVYIYNKENYIPLNYTAYLYKIKLY